MLRAIRRFISRACLALAGNERARLLAKYPDHLALIDSREIPSTYDKGPDLTYYTESAQYYYQLICDSAPLLKDKPRGATQADRGRAAAANNRIVHAEWGLTARGAEAVPWAVKLVTSKDRDLREAGANVFSGLRDPQRMQEVVSHLVTILESEQDRLVIDTMLGALGNLRSREAIPILRRFIDDEAQDGDTRWESAVNLGRIVGRRFEKNGANPIDAARDWLAKNDNT